MVVTAPALVMAAREVYSVFNRKTLIVLVVTVASVSRSVQSSTTSLRFMLSNGALSTNGGGGGAGMKTRKSKSPLARLNRTVLVPLNFTTASAPAPVLILTRLLRPQPPEPGALNDPRFSVVWEVVPQPEVTRARPPARLPSTLLS